MERIFKIFLWVLGFLLFLNLLLLDFFWISGPKDKTSTIETDQVTFKTPTPTVVFNLPESGDCSSQCKAYIEKQVLEAISSNSQKELTPTPRATPTPFSSSLRVSYLPIASAGSTQNTEWTDIFGTDFYFDLADYPSSKAVRFEVSLQSYLSSDPAYIRLYDVSNKRAVDGSELTTRSSSYEYLQSGNLVIWRGNNLYRLQAKGSSGNVVNFSSPRLKIILE